LAIWEKGGSSALNRHTVVVCCLVALPLISFAVQLPTETTTV